MEDPTTIALNLTFFGTLGVGLVMFVGVSLAFVIILLVAGLGRLLATVATALFRGATSLRRPSGRDAAAGGHGAGTAPPAGAAEPAPHSASRPAKPARPARKEPQLSRAWAEAVESANARADARAKAGAAPEVSVRELPSPKESASGPRPARRQDEQRKAS